MSFLSILFLALGLSMDASCCNISNGLQIKEDKMKYAFLSSFIFGLFQALMPILGFLVVKLFSDKIFSVSHYIALIMLSLLGIKMIVDAFSNITDKEYNLSIIKIIFQGIATSIDALGVGVSLGALHANMYMSSLIIFIVTFIMSFIGFFVGYKFSNTFKKSGNLIGGIILILVGVFIFISK